MFTSCNSISMLRFGKRKNLWLPAITKVPIFSYIKQKILNFKLFSMAMLQYLQLYMKKFFKIATEWNMQYCIYPAYVHVDLLLRCIPKKESSNSYCFTAEIHHLIFKYVLVPECSVMCMCSTVTIIKWCTPSGSMFPFKVQSQLFTWYLCHVD